MKKAVYVLLLSLSATFAHAETWISSAKIAKIFTFGTETSSNKWACFSVDNGADKPLCFDHTAVGGAQQFSLILTAKTTSATVQLSFDETSSANFWFDNYKVKHVYIVR